MPATQAELERLASSLKHDKSAGVIPVRHLKEDDGGFEYEAIDGNHRLEAMELLGWNDVTVEDFGDVSLAEAITIARRRNFQWFEDDVVSLAHLYHDVVIPEIPVDDLVKFMPDTKQEIDQLGNIAKHIPEFEEPPDRRPTPEGRDDTKFTMVRASMPQTAYNVLIEAKNRAQTLLVEEGLSYHSDREIAMGQALEILAAEFLASFGVDDDEETEAS